MILKYLFDRLISLLGLVILSLVKLATVDHLQEYNDTVIYPDKVRLNCYYYRHYSFVKDIRKPTLPFVTEFTSGIYQNQRWQWNWRWDDEERRYHVYDLSVMCPKCKTGILTIYFDGYQCGKCGAEFDVLGIDHEGVKRQILADARNAYPQFKDSVSDMWMV